MFVSSDEKSIDLRDDKELEFITLGAQATAAVVVVATVVVVVVRITLALPRQIRQDQATRPWPSTVPTRHL